MLSRRMAQKNFVPTTTTTTTTAAPTGFTKTSVVFSTKGSLVTLSNGNKTAVSGVGYVNTTVATGIYNSSSGNLYFEIKCNAINNQFGIGLQDAATAMSVWPGGAAGSYAYMTLGTIGSNGNQWGYSYGDSYGINDVIGISVMFSTFKVWFSKNGVWQGGGNPATGINPAFTMTPGNKRIMLGGVNSTSTYTATIY
jgi:hypothetical protein